MTDQQRLDLISIYPEMFEDSKKIDPIGSGWFEILKEAIENIKDYDDSLNNLILQAGYTEDKKITRISQIKGNDGFIRLHISGDVPDALSRIAYNLERESSRTCENCGTNSMIGSFSYGWVKTLCKNCAKDEYAGMERRNALRNNTDFEDVFIIKR
jgi:hypothetical protein